MSYCASRFHTVRRPTLEVMVGGVGVGGTNPIRLQSMTTSDTQDVAATVKQSIALAEVGCEIVRITAPNVAAAKCLKDIRAQFTAAGFGHVPLVADIHFLPSAAMEAVEHVEKVRVNPGNYADKKKFAVREYSDADYETELQRLLNPNRNPSLSKAEIEQMLRDNLGVKQILWLGDGIVGDDTDGHIDDLSRFYRSDGIVTVVERRARDANHAVLQENLERLQRLRTPAGKKFKIVELPMPEPCFCEGQRLPASYANFLNLDNRFFELDPQIPNRHQ